MLYGYADGYLEFAVTWTLAQAKDQLSEVVRRAVDQGPQTISVRGKETAVVMSKAEFEVRNPPASEADFKTFLLSIPSLEGADITRNPAPSRDIDI